MDFHLLPFLKVFGVALGAGFVGAILGLGGGIIVIPVLSSLMGYGIRPVIGASLISVIATSSGAAAAYVRDRLTNLRVAMFLELATVTGAILGAWLSRYLPARALFILFGLLLLYSAYGMVRRRRLAEDGAPVPPSEWARRLRLEGDYHDEATDRTIRYRAGRLLPGFLVMSWAGAVSGVLGIGSGILKVIGMD
ncbi:MAG: sulfite exporter TauE/SafE family protein, partial [Armatimonadetes bacterium]|nr:sulfite exporter TauE/SafE family protein [Armatimonadota bacterium]